jgi:SAM-dependent methyltransferase
LIWERTGSGENPSVKLGRLVCYNRGSMDDAPQVIQLFSTRTDSYLRFIRAVLYRQGIRAYFLRSAGLQSGLRVLDAGCGTGAVTVALHEALRRRGLWPGVLHGFDLTPAMLDRLELILREKGVAGVETKRADVLDLGALPGPWRDYDLIVSASMLEYVPRARFAEALAALRRRLAPRGSLVLFVTKRNWLTRLLIGRWWRGNLYAASELRGAFETAGFDGVVFGRFPVVFGHLNWWGHIVTGRNHSRGLPINPPRGLAQVDGDERP